MTILEKVIINFDGKRESLFLKYITDHELLEEKEKSLINSIWKEASKFELWNYANLNIGKRNVLNYLKAHYDINPKALKKIVNAISYEWL